MLLRKNLANARSLIREGQPCEIVMISDLIEWDSAGLQYPRDMAKPLPRIDRLDLKGCTVTALGAGQRLSPKEEQKVLTNWDKWLKAAGADNVSLSMF